LRLKLIRQIYFVSKLLLKLIRQIYFVSKLLLKLIRQIDPRHDSEDASDFMDEMESSKRARLSPTLSGNTFFVTC
jgi:hypothetical protein